MRGHGEGSKATRFGQDDGRPRPGRKKGARDERTLLQLIKDLKVTVNLPGVPARIDTHLAYLLKLRERALKGDLKAIEMLDRKLAQYAIPSVQPDLTADLLAEDIAIIENARLRLTTPLPIYASPALPPQAGSTVEPQGDPT